MRQVNEKIKYHRNITNVFSIFAGAKAVVLDFETPAVTNNLQGYEKFSWDGFGVLDVVTHVSGPIHTDYTNAQSLVTPGSKVAYNVNAISAKIDFGQAINFQGAYFASAAFEPNWVTVTGYYWNGTSITKDIELGLANGQWEQFDFNGITSLSFDSLNFYFGMDDFTYTTMEEPPAPTPEPSSLVLGLMGIAGLLKEEKRVKKNYFKRIQNGGYISSLLFYLK